MKPRIKASARTPGGQARRPHAATRSLYVGNIHYETTDAELNRIFRGLENVTDVRVAVDRSTGWPRGFAHADFADVESAARALKKLRGIAINGRELRIDFAQEVDRSWLVDRRRDPKGEAAESSPKESTD